MDSHRRGGTTLPGASVVEAAEVACAAFAGSAAGGDVGTTLPGASLLEAAEVACGAFAGGGGGAAFAGCAFWEAVDSHTLPGASLGAGIG